MSFVCNNYDHTTLIPSILEELNINNEKELHYNKDNIIKVAINTKEFLRDSWIKLPFCNTIEGELLGAKVSLTMNGAKIKEPCFNNINQVPNDININSERLNIILEALYSLNNENIIYNLEGPFTILNYLLDTTAIFKAINRQKEDFFYALNSLEEFIISYGTLIYNSGTNILSFGDPLGTKDILGPKLFNDIYINSFRRIIKGIIHNCPKVTIHICGKLSQNLVDANAVEVSDYKFSRDINYGEALLNYTKLDCKEPVIGLMCVNRTILQYSTIHKLRIS